MFNSLRIIIESKDTKAGRNFDIFIQFLIIVSIIIHSLETVKGLNNFSHIFSVAEKSILFLFIVEYLLRILVSTKKLKFIFSFYGVIDLFAILPGLLTLGSIDLRFLRAFRLIRLFRVFKLLRYSKAIERLYQAFKDIKAELIVYGCFSIILLYISSSGIYYFENVTQPDKFSSIPQSFWWSICTLTTVGYGDVYPVTTGGQVFTSIILFIGVGIIAVPSGLFASALSKKN